MVKRDSYVGSPTGTIFTFVKYREKRDSRGRVCLISGITKDYLT